MEEPGRLQSIDRVTESRTRLSDFTFTTFTYIKDNISMSCIIYTVIHIYIYIYIYQLLQNIMFSIWGWLENSAAFSQGHSV